MIQVMNSAGWMMISWIPRTVLVAVIWMASLGADVNYRVEFTGTLNREALDVLNAHSQLVALQDRPPVSLISLKRRAQADIPHLIQSLHSLAFFNAEVDIDVDEEVEPAIVRIHIESGPVFTLSSFDVLPANELRIEQPEEAGKQEVEEGQRFIEQEFLAPSTEESFDWEAKDTPGAPVEFIGNTDDSKQTNFAFDGITPECLGLQLGAPALPQKILEAEDALLVWINEQGYPLAEVRKREVVADQAAYTVCVRLYVEEGPLAYLASPEISGYTKVRECYIARKVTWCPGERYAPELVAGTFDALECSGLFRSINIELGTELNEDGLLPVDIHVNEACQRSLGAGINYSTEFGFGLIGEWEHRNVGGMGETFSAKAELLRKYQDATLSHRIPDFLCKGLNLVNTAQLERELTDSFNETAWIYSSRLHRHLTDRLQAWVGLALKYTYSTKTDNDRHFTLIELPLQLRHTTVCDVLDPLCGSTINLKFTPAHRLFVPTRLNYYTMAIDAAYYRPAPLFNWITLAAKISLGSIQGAARQAIPPPERFYAGTPSTLRGYRYLTVSPLDDQGRPEGGRSLAVLSLEARARITDDWGLVGFWEGGNVYSARMPCFNKHQLQSAGLGIRYYTPVGPLRLDIAVPLNRRRLIDPPLQLYFSIGQTY